MGFPKTVADEVFVRCARHCCLCGKYAGSKMELHHIRQAADGGDDSADNCIPLCFDCHAEVKAYNPHHPKGRKFTETELKGHRERIYALVENRSVIRVQEENSTEHVTFPPLQEKVAPIWGFPKADQYCPLLPGKMVLIAGYTGMRKSAYAQHVVNSSVIRGCRAIYCCLKDHPLDVSMELIAENSAVNYRHLRQGTLTENEWRLLVGSAGMVKGSNIVMVPFHEAGKPQQLLSLIKNSGAEIVVVDDMNGIAFDAEYDLRKFTYQVKSAAAQSNTVVVFLYAMDYPRNKRIIHPELTDFPSEDYYRLFDVVQFIYRSTHIDVEYSKNVLTVDTVRNSIGGAFSYRVAVHNELAAVRPVAEDEHE